MFKVLLQGYWANNPVIACDISISTHLLNLILVFSGPPEEINTLKVEGGCDDLQAKLTWSTVHKLFDPIKYFIIEWRTSYESDKWYNYASRVPSHRREKVVKDLSPYALYSFRVLAVNAIGTSDNIYNTDFIDCKTPARGN